MDLFDILLIRKFAGGTTTSPEIADMIEELENAIQDATNATASANAAANRLSQVTMDVEMLPPNTEPTANVEQNDTQTNFSLGIPKSNYVYATFEVDENMDLLMHAPEGFEGVNFELNNGTLEVIV